MNFVAELACKNSKDTCRESQIKSTVIQIQTIRVPIYLDRRQYRINWFVNIEKFCADANFTFSCCVWKTSNGFSFLKKMIK